MDDFISAAAMPTAAVSAAIAPPHSGEREGHSEPLSNNGDRSSPSQPRDTADRPHTPAQIMIVVHQADSDPGLIGQLLQQRGYRLDIRCPAIGDRLPAVMDDYAATVVFGGPMSANDDDTLPFIRTELDWLPTVLEAQMPFLGVCLGAQLLARVLGGKVSPHPDGIREIGYFSIAPTAAGRSEFAAPMSVYHWHREGFEVPRDAVCLASGDTFANQAFRYGNSAYGVQFHPEITRPLIHKWTTKAADQLSLPGAKPRDRHFDDHDRHSDAVKLWLDQFLDRWLVSATQPTIA
ncbi:MAG TPA: hypothetical protein V6C88_11495, partial [Chroococcidiopsis sp.]